MKFPMLISVGNVSKPSNGHGIVLHIRIHPRKIIGTGKSSVSLHQQHLELKGDHVFLTLSSVIFVVSTEPGMLRVCWIMFHAT